MEVAELSQEILETSFEEFIEILKGNFILSIDTLLILFFFLFFVLFQIPLVLTIVFLSIIRWYLFDAHVYFVVVACLNDNYYFNLLLADELNVKYEEYVFDATIKWIEFDSENRTKV